MFQFSTVRKFSIVLILLTVGLNAFGQTPQSFLPNQTIEREIRSAEIHRYKFDVQKDEFFQIRVEQKARTFC